MFKLRLPIRSIISFFDSCFCFICSVSSSTVVSPFAFIPLGFSSAFSEDLGLSPHLQIQSSVVSILSIAIKMQC